MLGICVGIGAVVCTVAIGTAGAAAIRKQLENLGENLVWVEAGGRSSQGVRLGNNNANTLIMDDALAIAREVPLVRSVSPQVDGRVQVIYQEHNWNTSVRGITPAYLQIRHWQIIEGTVFDDRAVEQLENVCVIGQTVADRLFGDESPIGKSMRVTHLICEVKGVLLGKGQSPTGQDYDDTIFMPYTTVQRKILGKIWVDDIMCSANSSADITAATDQVIALMRQRHHIAPGAPDDFNIRRPEEIVKAQEEAMRTFMSWMAAVAAISLLVGCVGVMNIMLVSATERTREIGVRMAIGATTRHIHAQFLSEAVLLSAMGGACGIVAGIVGAELLDRFSEWHTQVSLPAILWSTVLSFIIGVISGYYPAQRAARLDPIAALRDE